MIPLLCTNIWLAGFKDKMDKGVVVPSWQIRTIPEERGLKHIRSSIRGLAPEVDVTIKDWSHPEKYGIGAMLNHSKQE